MAGFREQILEPKYTKAEARNTSFSHRESDSSTLDIELILILTLSPFYEIMSKHKSKAWLVFLFPLVESY